MLVYRRIFQSLDFNRLRRHRFYSIAQHKARRTVCSITESAHQPFVRSKSDTITHNDHIQNFDSDHSVDQIPQKNETFASNKLRPIEAMPCADKLNTSSFGNMIAIGQLMRQLVTGKWENRFHEEIDECHRRLGPIFCKSLAPNQSAIFVKSPDLLRDVFTYEGKYPKHPLPEAWTYYNQLHNCQRGLFFMDDLEWMETRRQLAPLMLRNDHRFSSAIECATDELIDNWKQIALNRNEFTALPQALTSLYGWSIRVLMGIMFGNASQMMCKQLCGTIDYFAQIVQNVFEDTVPFASVSPQLARQFRLPIWRKFEASVTDTLNIASEIIEFGLEQPECNGLLAEMKRLQMTTEMIKRIFIDLIIAAGDTTAFSTQWALYLLSTNQQQQENVRQEIRTVNHIHDTPLVRGTVREALRLFPVATFIGRILGKDAILHDYRIDKNSLVLISMYSAGRDETSFPHANQFQPSRWNRDPTTGALKLVNRAQSSIPYAIGARNCIGQRIANAQMHIILSKLLRTFKVQLLNANEIDIVMRLIIMPSKPMRFAVKPID